MQFGLDSFKAKALTTNCVQEAGRMTRPTPLTLGIRPTQHASSQPGGGGQTTGRQKKKDALCPEALQVAGEYPLGSPGEIPGSFPNWRFHVAEP